MKMKKTLLNFAKCSLFLSAASTFVGCVNAARNTEELHSTNERNMTVGIVQKEIRPGMSQADVADALGSPNIVSNGDDGRETWIYDKVASEASYSNSRGNVGGLAGIAAEAGSVLLLGLAGGSYSKDAGASASTQKTLTVVIRFDRSGRVERSTYHSSKF